MNWEPIASAPFGKPVLVWVPFGWGMGVAIKAHSGRWVSSPPTEVEFKPLLSEPTHWMELPESPK